MTKVSFSIAETGSVERICRAAEEEFGSCGLERANVRAIAERAGVSWQLVYRYFPKKEALYAETIQRFSKRFYEHLLKADLISPDPAAVIRAFARQMASLFDDYPFAGPLVLDQILHKGRQIKGDRRANNLRQNLLAAIGAAIRDGVTAGTFRSNRSPEGVFFLALVVSLGYTTMGRLLGYIALDVPELQPDGDIVEIVADIVVGSLRA